MKLLIDPATKKRKASNIDRILKQPFELKDGTGLHHGTTGSGRVVKSMAPRSLLPATSWALLIASGLRCLAREVLRPHVQPPPPSTI